VIRSVDQGKAQNGHEAEEYRDFCVRYGADPGEVALLPLHTAGPRPLATHPELNTHFADGFPGLPTIFEETMLASVETLSCGTPVILSSEADMPYVADGGSGFVVEFSVGRVVGCMAQIAADQGGFRSRARSIADARFSEAAACGALRE
jgi:hypothetical protein